LSTVDLTQLEPESNENVDIVGMDSFAEVTVDSQFVVEPESVWSFHSSLRTAIELNASIIRLKQLLVTLNQKGIVSEESNQKHNTGDNVFGREIHQQAP
jgi:hypothetical protein